ncbi:MAG: hypothetical protein ACHQ4H_16055 [Ktedonobacterales bacterium]
MKTRSFVAVRMLILCVCLALAACTSGTTTTGLASPTAGKAPTAVPTVAKAKPTSFPTINLAFCHHILSVAEANQFMQPAIPATMVEVGGSTPTGGSCNYQATSSALSIKVIVYLFQYTGPPPPIPQSTIQAMITDEITQLTSQGDVVPTYTLTPVSGVGDQAEFATISYPSGLITKVTIFYVIYGDIFFDCVNYFDVGSSSDATQMSGLQQCAQTVVSRL